MTTDIETMGYVIATCLAPKSKRVIRTHVRPNRTVHRQFARGCRPIGQFDHEGDMTTLAQHILRRMRKNRHTTGAGAYLLGDEGGQVYVVAEGSVTGVGFVARNEGWIIGRYCAGIRGLLPLADHIVDDLREHFKGLIRVEVAA